MSTAVVIISSSPPRFAHSPTPADISSPLRSQGTPIKSGAKRFKTSTQVRDGFPSGFSSARALLSKPGVENIPLRSPSAPKFKSQRTTSPSPGTPIRFVKRKTNDGSQHVSHHFKRTKPSQDEQPAVATNVKAVVTSGVLGEHCPDIDELVQESLPKAIARRRDWTPPKTDDVGIEKAMEVSNPISLSSFAFVANGAPRTDVDNALPQSEKLSKRKQVDPVVTSKPIDTATSMENPPMPTTKRKVKPKPKAPAKRPMTITGLSMSTYASKGDDEKLPPMLDYLTSTQPVICEDTETSLDVKLVKSRATKKTKKASVKMRLESPTSAMKTTSEQVYLFGSASQLARDESPAHQVTKHLLPTASFSSDPVSPLRTQTSIASPHAKYGAAASARRKDLWGAGWRDDDNALLHMETIDLIESPAVRNALAGKDVLVDSLRTARRSSVAAAAQTSYAKGPAAQPIVDIADFDTPLLSRAPQQVPQQQVRAMHTTRDLLQSHPNTGTESETSLTATSPTSKAKADPKKAPPVMPNYQGWSDHALKKQISAYGFKAIKKRETMIAKLEDCWRNLNEPDEDDAWTNMPKHSDIVSNVHDLSSRPIPKVKKPKDTKRKSEGDGTETSRASKKRKSEVDENQPPKEPKRRRKSTPKDENGEQTSKPAPRKRKPKKTLSDEKVLDVDDLPEQVMASVEAGPVVSGRPATPPPTKPTSSLSSLPASEDSAKRDQAPILTPEQTQVPDIMTQIRAAIYQPEQDETRNHQTNPTWREKILMYDPIVLEELTVWLNTEGFKAIKEDREISPLEVRSWCEQNGVCCYGVGGGWRGRNRGNREP
jgi:hypothetical protein